MSGPDNESSRPDSGIHIENGVAIEGRYSNSHVHNDGTYGRDLYGVRAVYQDGKIVSETSLKGEYPKFHE